MIRIDPKMIDTASKLDAYFGVRLLALDGLADFFLHRSDAVPNPAHTAVLGPEAAVRAAIHHLMEKNPSATLDARTGRLVCENGTQVAYYAVDFEQLRATTGLDVLSGLIFSSANALLLDLWVTVTPPGNTVTSRTQQFKHRWDGADPDAVRRHAESVAGDRDGKYTVRDRQGGPPRLEWEKKPTDLPVVHYAVKWIDTPSATTVYMVGVPTDADLYYEAATQLARRGYRHRGDTGILVSEPNGDTPTRLIRGNKS